MDIVNKQTRSKMMSNIKSKNTKPEIIVRSLLHQKGFRFRLHDKELPGKPDIILKNTMQLFLSPPFFVFFNRFFVKIHN